MARFEQEFLKPGRYHLGGGRYRTFTAGDLGRYAENTRKLMRKGYRIPVLARHAPPGSVEGGPERDAPDGDRRDRRRESPDAVVGRVVDVRQKAGGALVHVVELDDPNAVHDIQRGGKGHTSPELRERFTDASGETFGPVITHVALTRRPRNREQAPLRPSGDVLQLSLNDLIPGTSMMKEKDAPATVVEDGDKPDRMSHQTATGGAEKPLTDRQGTDADSDAGGASADEDPSGEGARETAAPRDETADRQNDFRTRLTERIRQSKKLPRGLRDRLLAIVDTVQLSEDGDEEPTLRLSDAVALLEESMPAHVQLDADRLQQPGHPGGEVFFTGDAGRLTEDEAERIAGEQLAASGFAPRRKSPPAANPSTPAAG